MASCSLSPSWWLMPCHLGAALHDGSISVFVPTFAYNDEFGLYAVPTFGTVTLGRAGSPAEGIGYCLAMKEGSCSLPIFQVQQTVLHRIYARARGFGPRSRDTTPQGALCELLHVDDLG